MNNIEKIRATFSHKAFIPFITGGDPDLETTRKLINTLAESGADLIEIGIPFSDPVAEGPVIEAADERALSGGCTVDKIFEMIKGVDVKIPILLMTYYNPIFGYGSERFVENCVNSGVSGLIVPDLPFDEREELKLYTDRAGLALISLIAPTSGGRIPVIAKASEGFLYCVSSLGVTGTRSKIGGNITEMVKAVREVSDIPCAVGFGVSDAVQAKEMSKFADGVIVGSAIVKICAKYGRDCIPYVEKFAKSIAEIIKL
ncbi:MAG: tryptophan synthase subunit alpha [Ruminococcus sp.]|jgi:tryptophan synthase alpha chain|nr:tryptophan synthase subunit alpha [Ruminococcus sp.]